MNDGKVIFLGLSVQTVRLLPLLHTFSDNLASIIALEEGGGIPIGVTKMPWFGS